MGARQEDQDEFNDQGEGFEDEPGDLNEYAWKGTAGVVWQTANITRLWAGINARKKAAATTRIFGGGSG